MLVRVCWHPNPEMIGVPTTLASVSVQPMPHDSHVHYFSGAMSSSLHALKSAATGASATTSACSRPRRLFDSSEWFFVSRLRVHSLFIFGRVGEGANCEPASFLRKRRSLPPRCAVLTSMGVYFGGSLHTCQGLCHTKRRLLLCYVRVLAWLRCLPIGMLAVT